MSYTVAKRALDLLVSSIALVLLLPLMVVIALSIKRDSAGPVLYRGRRVGKAGREFRMLKFRTMVADADGIGGPSTPGDDPRITRIGHFLRRYKLDELPQLANVLKGQMSLVGPRPEVERYVRMYSGEEKEVLSIPPGMTDWASLWNPDEGAVLAGAADPEQAYMDLIRPTKLRLQIRYVRERSMVTDLRILLATVGTVVLRRRLQLPQMLASSGGDIHGKSSTSSL